RDGVLRQAGAPRDVYLSPVDRETAEFLGQAIVRANADDPVEAERVETELLTVAYVDSFELPITLQFTAEIIRTMHRDWLGDLYPTAGEYRAVNLSKGGFTFCAAAYVAQEMERFEREQLAEHTPCRELVAAPYDSGAEREFYKKARIPKTRLRSVEEVAFKTSVVHAELLLIHPFREGNGRLGRWLADLMILQGGYPAPEYDLDDDPKREAYYSAMRKAYGGDFTALTALFVTWIERAQQLPVESRRTSP
ncbi:MAG: Fic family protein, partial [Fimbriimonadaceae bacterium]